MAAKLGRISDVIQVPARTAKIDLYDEHDRKLPQATTQGDKGQKHLSERRVPAQDALSCYDGCTSKVDRTCTELGTNFVAVDRV